MGFEELAALKQQLSKQSQGKRETNDGASRNARATQSERKALAAAATNSAEQSRTTESRAQGAARPGQAGGQKRAQTPGQARPASGRGPRPDGASRSTDGARRTPRRNGNPSQPRDPKAADGAGGVANPVSADQGQQPSRSGAGKRPPRERQAGVGHPTRPARPERQVDPVVLTIGQLQKHFPLAFPKNPEPKKPLKLGISKDLAAQAETLSLTEPAILEAIKVWCQGSRYWAAMTNGAARVDLNGEADGTVTPEQAGHARYLAAAARRAKRQDKPSAEGTPKTSAPDAAVAEGPEAASDGSAPTSDAADITATPVAEVAAAEVAEPAAAAATDGPAKSDAPQQTGEVSTQAPAAPSQTTH